MNNNETHLQNYNQPQCPQLNQISIFVRKDNDLTYNYSYFTQKKSSEKDNDYFQNACNSRILVF